MKGDNPSLKHIKGDNVRDITICAGYHFLFDSQF